MASIHAAGLDGRSYAMALRGGSPQDQEVNPNEVSKKSRNSKAKSYTTQLKIPSEIWSMVLQYITEDFYLAGASEKVYALTHSQCEMGSYSIPDGLALDFWHDWWPIRIRDIEKQLQQYRRLMKRRYSPNRTIDRAIVPLRSLYFEVMDVWADQVVGTMFPESQWYVWVAEWILEKLKSTCPIDERMQMLSRLDGVWPEICREGWRLQRQLEIMQNEIDYMRSERFGNEWVRSLPVFQEPPEPSKESKAQKAPKKIMW